MGKKGFATFAAAMIAAPQSFGAQAAGPAHHHHHWRSSPPRVVYVRPYPRYVYVPIATYPSYSYYSPPPPVTYIEQPQAYPDPGYAPGASSTRFFCPELRRFYPEVRQCPGGWMQVLPGRVPAPG